MPKPTKGARLGGSPAHQKAILANLATQLFEHGAITTTEAKARRLRPFAERLITKARRGDLHNRRQVLRVIRDKTVVHLLFTEIAPKYAERPGGYTRITKTGPRKGDNAPMAVIELIQEEYSPDSAATSAPAAPQPAATPAPETEDAQPEETPAPAEAAETEESDTEEPEAAEPEAAEPTSAESEESDTEGAESAPAEDEESQAAESEEK